jgi:energy-coupling factor transporter transmembrane protein EcfT
MIENKFKSVSIFRLLITLFTLTFVVFNEYQNDKSQVLYGSIIYALFCFIILAIFILVVIFDFLLFYKSKQIKSLTPTLIGIILITISITIHKYHIYKINQKTIYKATSNCIKTDDSNIRYEIEFKENGNFVAYEDFEDGVFTKFYYGKYEKKDSIIQTDCKIGEKNISNRLLITETKNIKNKISKQLIQLDKKGKKITTQLIFIFKIN